MYLSLDARPREAFIWVLFDTMPADSLHPLEQLLRERIVIIDGAMGTMVQRYRSSQEADFRGERFRDWEGKDLNGNNEALLITKPDIIEEIHTKYLEAGADIIETNTFGATTIGQHDFFFREDHGKRKDQDFFQRVVEDPFLRDLALRDESQGARSSRGARRIGWARRRGSADSWRARSGRCP